MNGPRRGRDRRKSRGLGRIDAARVLSPNDFPRERNADGPAPRRIESLRGVVVEFDDTRTFARKRMDGSAGGEGAESAPVPSNYSGADESARASKEAYGNREFQHSPLFHRSVRRDRGRASRFSASFPRAETSTAPSPASRFARNNDAILIFIRNYGVNVFPVRRALMPSGLAEHRGRGEPRIR